MNKNKLASEICRTGRHMIVVLLTTVFVQTYCQSFILVNDILTHLFFARHLTVLNHIIQLISVWYRATFVRDRISEEIISHLFIFNAHKTASCPY